MKLATRHSDGRLIVVSSDLACGVMADVPTLLEALENWDEAEPRLRAQYEAITSDDGGSFAINFDELDAALPRTYQFLDASAFLAHNHILAKAWKFEPRGESEPPLIYQGISHLFYPPHHPVPFRSIEDNIDLEAEYAIITDAVPLGVTPEAGLDHVRLIVLLNDWSLRAFGPAEMRGGFGFLQAKPPCSMSAFAVTPDELGTAWRNGRVCLPLSVHHNGQLFGRPNGAAMHFSFGDLIAHAAATRDLCAGTVIGSGTVSNYDAEIVGSGCIAERRALDILRGASETAYLQYGDRVRLEAFDASGTSIWGAIDQEVANRLTTDEFRP